MIIDSAGLSGICAGRRNVARFVPMCSTPLTGRPRPSPQSVPSWEHTAYAQTQWLLSPLERARGLHRSNNLLGILGDEIPILVRDSLGREEGRDETDRRGTVL